MTQNFCDGDIVGIRVLNIECNRAISVIIWVGGIDCRLPVGKTRKHTKQT